MRALGSNVGAVWRGAYRHRQRRRAVSRTALEQLQGADQRLQHGGNCTFSSGQFALFMPVRHPSGHVRSQQQTAAPWARACPRLACSSNCVAGRGQHAEHWTSSQRKPASRRPPVASRQLGPWVLIAVLCTRWQGPRTKLLLQAGLGTSPDAPRALSFPRKKSLTRTNLLKHPSTMPDFFAARRLLQHPQPRHPRD